MPEGQAPANGTGDMRSLCLTHGSRLEVVERAIEKIDGDLTDVKASVEHIETLIEDKHGTLVELLTHVDGKDTLGGTVVLKTGELCKEVVTGSFEVAKGKTGFVIALAILVGALTGSGMMVKSDWFEMGPVALAAKANEKRVEISTEVADAPNETAEPLQPVPETQPSPLP